MLVCPCWQWSEEEWPQGPVTAAFQNYCPSSDTGPLPTNSSTDILLACLILITALGVGCHYPFYYGQTECYGPVMYASGVCSEWLVPKPAEPARPRTEQRPSVQGLWAGKGSQRGRGGMGVPLARAPRAGPARSQGERGWDRRENRDGMRGRVREALKLRSALPESSQR